MADVKTTKHAFGSKANIDSAKTSGAVDAFDVLHLDNGEMAWIDKDGNTVMATSRTQEGITVNGVTGLGIGNGETIPAGASIDEIVKMLVQKAVPASYTKPTVSLTNNGGQASGNVEAGTSITPKLKATFTKNDAGDLTSLSISTGGTAVVTGTSSPQTYEGEAVVIGDETITYTASASYDAAPVKKNNLGQESKENWFDAGSISSSSYSITGKRNLFYGTGVGTVSEVTSAMVRGLNNTKLAPTQGYKFTINVSAGQQYVMFAYPDNLRDVNKVFYVEGNDPNLAANFTKKELDVADARGGENGLYGYKAYYLNMSTPAKADMTLEVTI